MSNSPEPSRLLAHWAPRVVISGVAAAVLLAGAAYWAAMSFGGGADGGKAAVAGVATALLGGQLAMIPSFAALTMTPAAFAIAGLLNLCIRFVATLSLALAVSGLLSLNRDATLLWVAGAQAALLAVDCVWLVRMSRAVTAEADRARAAAGPLTAPQAEARS
jgi:hypothetical protein